MTGPFRPAPFLGNAHAQTLFAYFARPRHVPPLRRERWETPDGDFVDLDLLAAPPEAPHVVVFHGLEGSSRSGYVRAVLREASARGWGGVAMNFRSCSGEANRLLRSYSSGETEDARWVLGELRARGLRGPLYAVGFSLGANVLLKLLAEDGDRSLIHAAAAISAPLELQRCARALDAARGLGALYRWSFLRSLKRKSLSKARRFPQALDIDAIRAARGIEAFDEAVTAKVFGFESAADYYRRSSAGPLLEQVRRPTLLLSAADDPMVPGGGVPEAATLNTLLTIEVTPHGGHVGFVTGVLWKPVFWAERRALEFFSDTDAD